MASPQPRPESVTVAPLTILSLPDEILIEIFEAVKQSGRHTRNRPPVCPTYTPSSNDIANVRLACRRLAATSSHLLVSSVHLDDISSASLKKLEAIAHHPEIGKGVRTVRLSTCFYTPALAADARTFAWYAINRVFGAAVRCQERIQAERKPVEEADCGISEAQFTRWMNDIAALEDVMEVLKSWSQLTMSEGSEMMGSPLPPRTSTTPRVRDANEEARHVMLLRIAHALYRSRYQDQEMLLANGRFVERFSQAVARMPRAKVLEVVDFKHDDRDCPTCRSSVDTGDALLEGEVDLYESLLDIDSFIQPSSWDEALTHGWSAVPPVELLLKLPVALRQADIQLDRIAYSTGLCTEDYYPLLARATNNAEDFVRLGSAVRGLGIKSFAFLQGDEVKPFAHKTPTSEHVHTFKKFIRAMTNSDRLERLRLRLGGGWSDGSLDPDHRHNLGDLLWPAPAPAPTTTVPWLAPGRQAPWGQNLRDISITGLPLAHADLESLATHLRDAGTELDFLSLSRVCLVSGSWRDALDTLRGIEARCNKSLFAPSGAECDDVTMQLTERYDKIFCAEPGSGSVAECYMNGEVQRNPFKSGWAVDFVYSVDGDEVVVSVISSEEEDEGEEDDDDDSEDEEAALTGNDAKGLDGGSVYMVEEVGDDLWEETPLVEHVEYA